MDCKKASNITTVYLLDSARRAVKGNVSPNVRAILMNYSHNHLILKCYLDSIPTDIDREMLSDIAGEIVGDFPRMKSQRLQRFARLIILESRDWANMIHLSIYEITNYETDR